MFAAPAVLQQLPSRLKRPGTERGTNVSSTTLDAPIATREPRDRPHHAVIPSLERLVGLTIAVVSLVPVLRYVWVVVHRIGFPFELEWMEGGAVEVVHRVVQAQGIYGPPSLHFTPWPYTPLYFWVSAAVAKVTGIGFTPLRVVSFAASVVVLWLAYRLVAGETGDRIAGLAAAGVYAATFRLGGAWADIGRVDSLFLAFTLAALIACRRAKSRRAGAVAGLLFFLAFFTKQDALVVALPVLVWMLFARRRAGAAALATLAGLVVVSTVVLDAFSHGWYSYYVFEELLRQGIVTGNWVDFWRFDVLHPLLPALALVVGGVVALAYRYRHLDRVSSVGARAPVGFWLAAIAGLLVASWAGRLHDGGFNDVLMPGYVALSLAVGLVLGLLRRHPKAVVRVALSGAAVLVLWAQFQRIGYSVDAQVPTAADERAGKAFIALVQHLPGKVLVYDHPYYGVLAGKGTVADEEAVDELLRSGPSTARRVMIGDLRRALLAPGIDAVIFDDPGDERYLQAELASAYHLLPEPAVHGHVFFPVTDLPLRPQLVFVRNNIERGAQSRAT